MLENGGKGEAAPLLPLKSRGKGDRGAKVCFLWCLLKGIFSNFLLIFCFCQRAYLLLSKGIHYLPQNAIIFENRCCEK